MITFAVVDHRRILYSMPPLRSWAAALAGVAGMPYGAFTFYNAAGGVAWASLFGTLGYLFGRKLPRLERVTGQATLALALLVTLGVVLTLLFRRVKRACAVSSLGNPARPSGRPGRLAPPSAGNAPTTLDSRA